MTLLLGAKCTRGIVLMADGLCRQLHPDGMSAVLATDLKKLYPLSTRPIAIGHHGQNVLAGHPVAEWIRQMASETEGVATVAGIVDHIEGSLDRTVRATLSELAVSGIRDACGFWVGGYGVGETTPTLLEAFWEPGGAGRCMRVSFEVLAEGGDGKAYTAKIREKAPSFNFRQDAQGWSLYLWHDYLDRLYRRAWRLPGASAVFGGRRLTYWITPAGCRQMNCH